MQVLTSHQELVGVILTSVLALRTRKGPKVYENRTRESESFWDAYHNITRYWGAPFKDCFSFPRSWFYAYVTKRDGDGVGFFLPLKLNQCDSSLSEIFGGPHHCDQETTFVSNSQTYSTYYYYYIIVWVLALMALALVYLRALIGVL